MSRAGSIWVLRCTTLILLFVVCLPLRAQDNRDPHKILQEADRRAWLRAWTRAAPLYAEAEQLFAARGDRRNELYAQISKLRGELPRLAVPDVSQRLSDYLEDPVVRADDRLRLRCLIIKGETDEDLDPSMSRESWQEALQLAEKLGEPAWANRAQGELGLVAFLLGDINNSVIRLGQALKIAESNGDVSSVVRWLTLFGHGYVELGRAEQALEFYDRALKIASGVPELQFPLMTHLGRGDALVRLGRVEEAEGFLDAALVVARREGALGYQAELTLKKGLIAFERKQVERALTMLADAATLARQAGGNRILANIALERARMERASGKAAEADRTLREGIEAARSMGERLLLPRLLALQADVRGSQARHSEASDLLAEATDLLEGLLTNASSPWVRSRVISGMDDVLLARVRLEGARGRDPERLFSAIEQAKGRSLLDLLLSTPLADIAKSVELRGAERRISSLQLRLLRSTSQAERDRLLNDIFVAEEQMAPAATAMFTLSRTRAVARKPVLHDVQRALRPDEVLLDFALSEPSSYAVIVTRGKARIHRLAGQAAVETAVQAVLNAVHSGTDIAREAATAGRILITGIPELSSHSRVVISADGELHRLPFELLVGTSGQSLLKTHTVSYVTSGSVLSVIRERRTESAPKRAALAISASPLTNAPLPSTNGGSERAERGVYDVDISKLPPLPSANDEARSAAAALGVGESTVLLADSATELELKKHPLHEYRVMHFAVHGIVSTKSPARSALVLRPAGAEDGLLQAREILTMRLAAELVTLSACDSGTGSMHGREGIASLVRPFLSAGGRSVVANLWTADDRFSLALMREFYKHIAAGKDVATALRQAKLTMLDQYGPRAAARFWSGVLVYGDGAGTVKARGRTSN